MKKQKTENNNEVNNRSESNISSDKMLYNHHLDLLPKFGSNWNTHNLLTMSRMSISRLLYYDALYKKIVGKTGVICEFGVQWGAGLSTLINLRGIYEPYNHSRKVFGFDTFEGFKNSDKIFDGPQYNDGDYKTIEKYENKLNEILSIQESQSPIPHIKKFELIKGDASETTKKWLKDNPHVIIALAIFDMDIYKPTKDVLKLILPRLGKGSIVAFDELNCKNFPGETIALDEVVGLSNLRLQNYSHQPNCSWFEVE